MISFLHFGDSNFEAALAAIVNRGETAQSDVRERVREIIEDVRSRGDEALIDYTARFDRLELTPAGLQVTEEEIEQAISAVSEESMTALRLAVERIGAFHARQKEQTWISTEEEDVLLGQMVRPLDRVGIYVPGGKAAYPSSVVMNAVPSFVHGDLAHLPEGPFDLIVANPPYVPRGELAGLMADVRDYEPVQALDGGEDGLDAYRALAAQAISRLAPGGCLLVEIGARQQNDVGRLFEEAGLVDVATRTDYAGIERVVSGRAPL